MGERVSFQMKINDEVVAAYETYVNFDIDKLGADEYQDAINDAVDEFIDFARSYFPDEDK